MLLGATVYPLSYPVFWSVFAGAAMVRMSCLASALAMSADVWILMFDVTLSGPGFHEMLGSAPACPLSNHTGEPWSPIVGPAIVPVPSPAVFHRRLRLLCWWRSSLAIARRLFFLSYVHVGGRPVESGCHEMLDSAPAYPLSNHTDAPWSVWSVLWRLLLLCLSRSHIPF